MIAYTAVFIGHRNYDHSQDALIEETLLTLIQDGYCRFLSGGMGEFDCACESCVRRLKARYPHIRLCLAVNSPRQCVESGLYDEIVTPGDLKEGLTGVSIPVRNKLMVQAASAAVCYVHRMCGGAYASFKLALHEALTVYLI